MQITRDIQEKPVLTIFHEKGLTCDKRYYMVKKYYVHVTNNTCIICIGFTKKLTIRTVRLFVLIASRYVLPIVKKGIDSKTQRTQVYDF